MAPGAGCAYPLRRMTPPTRAPSGAVRQAARRAIVFLALTSSPCLAQQPVVLHVPPSSAPAGQPLYLSATVLGAAPRDGVLAYRTGGEVFTEIPLRIEGEIGSAFLRADEVRAPLLEYYFRFVMAGDTVATYPSAGPDTHPMAVPIYAGESRLLPLSPAPGETLRVERPEIIALIEPPLEPGEEILVLLDGRDVTAQARVEPDHLALVLDEPLDAGGHEVRSFVLGSADAPAAGALERRWGFFLLPATADGPGPIGDVHGRIELGWALVAAGVSDSTAPYLPYPRSSAPQIDVQLRARAAGQNLSLLVDRDPIYDRRTRWTARAQRGGREFEAGYVFPYLSEDILAWLAADGMIASVGGPRRDSNLVLLRTERAQVGGGFASFNRYLAAASHETEVGPARVLAVASHGFDDGGSLPPEASEIDSTGIGAYVSPAVRNTVGGVELRGTRGRGALHGALAWSRLREGDAEREAWGARLGCTWHPSYARVALEYRNHRPGYFALGNPTVNSGEEGLFFEAALEGRRHLRGNLHLELYRDYETSQPQDDEPVRQFWARFDVPTPLVSSGASAYALLRHFRVPYTAVPYRSEYAALGLHDVTGLVGWAISASETRTREEATSLVWTGNLDIWYRPPGGTGELKTSLRWDRGTDDRGDLDYHRGGVRQEFTCRSHGYEARLSGEWLRRHDDVDPVQSYHQILLSLSCGRSF